MTTRVLPRSARRCRTAQQGGDVGEVEAGRRLVEDVERPAGRDPAQLARQLDPLGLAAREGRARLPQRHVAQAGLAERLQAGDATLGMLSKTFRAVVDPHRSTSPIERPLKRDTRASAAL